MAEDFEYREEEAFVNSIIGEGTRLSGEFDLNGLLRIDGEFHGKVRTKGKVLIGKNGIAECQIFAGTVVIGGKIFGDIFATERVILLSTGELVGNIKTPRIVIEEGVIFEGTCEIIENKEKFENAKKIFLEDFFNSREFFERDNLDINQVSQVSREKGIKNVIEDKNKPVINDSIDIKNNTKEVVKNLRDDVSLDDSVKAKQKV